MSQRGELARVPFGDCDHADYDHEGDYAWCPDCGATTWEWEQEVDGDYDEWGVAYAYVTGYSPVRWEPPEDQDEDKETQA